jgi:hypothetical protein
LDWLVFLKSVIPSNRLLMPTKLSFVAQMSSTMSNSYTTNKYLAQERSQNVTTPPGSRSSCLSGVKDADFVAIGLGGTNMLAMLWAISMGRRAVGVEIRGDPFLGVHWNIREDLYHQLGLIDKMMLDRYGMEHLPKRLDGSLISLADLFYSPSTKSRDIIPGAIIEGYEKELHMVGDIHHIEYIDDRWKHGKPHRTVTAVPAPTIPMQPDATKIRSPGWTVNMAGCSFCRSTSPPPLSGNTRKDGSQG